jgi:hypothetical protein
MITLSFFFYPLLQGVEVPDECITMPEEEISHEVAGKKFTVGVTVSNLIHGFFIYRCPGPRLG